MNRPTVLDHQGPYTKHGPVAAYANISERAFAAYAELTGGPQRTETEGKPFLAVRLMYIAEVTSTAIRLDGSWALSHAAMSLVRDRYEQVIRFSWLARQTDDTEMQKYLASYMAKVAKINATVPQALKDQLDPPASEPDIWKLPPPSKEERDRLEAWSKLDLLSMARKRDALEPLSGSRCAKQPLAPYYPSIYQQFSSVTHYDMFGVSMLGLHKGPDGQLVLAANPHWPAFLNLHNALFDIIQCQEACAAYFDAANPEPFDALLHEFEKQLGLHMRQW